MRAAALKIGKEMGIEGSLHEGVYSCVGGPNFETVAELAAMKILGIDAIGELTANIILAAHYQNKLWFLIDNENVGLCSITFTYCHTKISR